MENLHLIEVTQYGSTNHRSVRVRLYSHRFKESIFLSYDYSIGNILEQAELYLLKKGHNVTAHCETKSGYGVLCAAGDHSLFNTLK